MSLPVVCIRFALFHIELYAVPVANQIEPNIQLHLWTDSEHRANLGNSTFHNDWLDVTEACIHYPVSPVFVGSHKVPPLTKFYSFCYEFLFFVAELYDVTKAAAVKGFLIVVDSLGQIKH